MAFDYDGARAVAEEIITTFGAAGSVVKLGVTGGTDEWGDPIADVADVVITGIITPLLRYKLKEIDETNIKTGDSFVFFHSINAPEINMQTTINGITYRVVNIMNLDSVGGVNVYRRLQLRV